MGSPFFMTTSSRLSLPCVGQKIRAFIIITP
jgi:hypothetical protein